MISLAENRYSIRYSSRGAHYSHGVHGVSSHPPVRSDGKYCGGNGLVRSGHSNRIWYSSGYAGLFQFFSNPKFTILISVHDDLVKAFGPIVVTPIPILDFRILNTGSSVEKLDLALIVENVTDGSENLCWKKPTVGLTLQRLPKFGKAEAEIAVQRLADHNWFIKTLSTESSGVPHPLERNCWYTACLILSYEPSRTTTWWFGLNIDESGTMHVSKPSRNRPKHFASETVS